MEKGRRSHGHGKRPPPLAPPRRERAAAASFSASLLDTIYRSLDEGSDADATAADVADTPRRSEENAPAPAQFWWAKEAGGKPNMRRLETGPARRRHSGYASSTASSSDSASSSYSFSCSSASTTDTESTARRRRSPPPPPRRQPEEVRADAAEAEPPSPPNNKAKTKKGRPCFPGARLRPRDASGPSSPAGGPLPPPSPGSFACVLRTLFTSGRLPRKQPKTPISRGPQTPQRTSPEPAETPRASATSSERRSVRFCSDAEASSVVRRRVEELVRSLGELEENDEGSDSSSDLFELESLGGANGDELPVYGTTSLVANRAIAHQAVF
ncbi:protein BIG GRAIN 1 [Brachypodium distachyon]|uniref:Uncharacterized protein n=1 Tax=Brachypodium distachyon TaxID=15368 RepID=I1IQJ2_BRADI|nr:protein BIG GRAIN 1 [Brachypodium distachyon]KQJ90440.1 hypothetical protein BRADI_4g31530v3 [Brachypodium distachyon]|eukprot:XP_003576580.1 protein BIG GRAIN 1 [Brachypodium distachyon]